MTAGGIFLIVGGYFWGALPFSLSLARKKRVCLVPGDDVHIALLRQVGDKAAVLAGLVDFMKGAILVLIGFGLDLSVLAVSLAGVAVAVGQMWPPHGCFGERGNTVGAGVLIVLSLVYGAYYILFALVFFAAGFGIRYIVHRRDREHGAAHPLSLALPLGMLLGFASAPLLSWLSGQPWGMTLAFVLLLVIILLKRLTVNLRTDIEAHRDISLSRILVNRLLFDQTIPGQG